GNVDRRAGVGGVDGVQLPPAQRGIQNIVDAGAVGAALAEGDLPDYAGDVNQLDVEARRAAFGGEVADVLRVGLVIAGVVFERLFGIAHRLGPGERVEEV